MSPLLEAKNVSKYFGGLKAVDDVNIQVEKGVIFGIIGPNGAGKTTFFNCLTGLFALTSGNIYFKGKDITDASPSKVANLGMSRTFQNIKLFKYMTVLDNVKIGFHTQTKTNIWDAVFHTTQFKRDERLTVDEGMKVLKRVGLENYADEFALNLPYGNQRKLEIARALAVGPEILLLDEPAAGMNPAETASLMELIKKINEDGLTIVVIEHDMKFIMNVCDRIAVLNNGIKICEGTPGYVQCDKQVIEAYLGKGSANLKRKEVK